jgi:hypothetical protein
MAILTKLNDKGNLRRTSAADMPYNAQFPVLNQYTATSTPSQTVINLTFSIDQSVREALMLYVDGKLMRYGVGNDYLFTAVDVNNTSSQVTLNFALTSGLNIVAYKLGFKKESEFNMDNRFVQLYAAEGQAFQGFVDTGTNRIAATTSAGTPTAGTFYSTITNRASLPDLSQDLKPRLGIQRMMAQQIYQLQNEFGPNGEAVFGLANDTFGQVRFVGGFWQNLLDTNGQRPSTAGTSSTVEYAEITFYGTGLNCLIAAYNSTIDLRVSVDGGSEGSNILGGLSYSNVFNSRNSAYNQPVNMVNGLSLGIHTVKIRKNGTGASSDFNFYGYEVINQNATSTNVLVPPGISYIQGQKLTSASAQTFAYNSVATGTKGGRVLVYQASDGTIGKSFQAVNASQANLTSADHTNEEVVRTYYAAEFQAARTDDWSNVTAGAALRVFTLDDGTTTLMSSSSQIGANTATFPRYGVYFSLTNPIILNFVGSGVDIELSIGTGEASTYTVSVDGTSLGTLTYTVNTTKVYKIVSGLPYGTHILKIVPSGTAPSNIVLTKYITYQPKKPSLPSGAVELGDYNVLANYSSGTFASDTISTGVIRKTNVREFVYVGTWSITNSIGTGSNAPSGTNVATSTASDSASYTFFGTGFDLRYLLPGIVVQQYTLSIDGLAPSTANFPGSSTGGYGSSSITASTGVINTGSFTQYSGVYVTGLPLGLHTVKIVYNSGSSLSVQGIDIITPIYSAKSNINYDAQNTLSVGSNSISDNRQFTAIKENYLQKKNVSQSFGITYNPTTTVTTSPGVMIPEMSVTHTSITGRIKISYSTSAYNSAVINSYFNIMLNGAVVGNGKALDSNGSHEQVVSDSIVVNVAAGSTNKIDIYWYLGSAGTVTAYYLYRNILVEDI